MPTGPRNYPKATTTSTPGALPGQRGTNTSRGRTALRRVQVTPDLIRDPDLAARVLSDMQDNLIDAGKAAASNPFNYAYIAQSQSLTNGVQANIQHKLGVPWQYAFIIHSYAGAGPMWELLDASSSAPSGTNKAKVCSVTPIGFAVAQGTLTLATGTRTTNDPTITSSSSVMVSVLTQSGTSGTLYKVVPTTGSFTVTAINTSGTTVATDNSTLTWHASTPSSGTYDVIIVGQ